MLEFPTYGPKVIAGQHPLDDGALQSRIITENMGIISEGRKHKPYLPKCFWKDGADLQGRLLKWGRRVGEIHHKNVMKQMPDALDGRAQQVMLPLFALTPGKHRRQLETLANRYVTYVARETADTDDVAVLCALLDMKSPARFYPGDVADKVNKSREPYGQSETMSPHRAGKCLSRLGFEKATRTKRGIPFVARKDQISDLAKDFGQAAIE